MSQEEKQQPFFITPETFKQHLAMHEKIIDHMETLLYNKHMIEHGKGHDGEIVGLDINGETLTVQCYIEGFHGDYDHMEHHQLPLALVFDTDYMQTIKAAVDRKREQKQERQKLEAIQEKQERELAERREYERLRAKFNDK